MEYERMNPDDNSKYLEIEKKYNLACQQLHAKHFFEALDMFVELSEYKDSFEKALLCQYLSEVFSIKSNLDELRKTENDRKEREKERKKAKTNLFVLFLVCVVFYFFPATGFGSKLLGQMPSFMLFVLIGVNIFFFFYGMHLHTLSSNNINEKLSIVMIVFSVIHAIGFVVQLLFASHLSAQASCLLFCSPVLVCIILFISVFTIGYKYECVELSVKGTNNKNDFNEGILKAQYLESARYCTSLNYNLQGTEFECHFLSK